MIAGKEKWLWGLSALVLIVLFLASSTDLLIKEREREVHPISVIVGETTDDNYINFRKGMERAALELNADVRLITLYDSGDWLQQLDLILREVRDGAEALVIAPVNARAAARMVSAQQIYVPVVFLNGDMSMENQEKADNLTFDYGELGRQTGEHIIKNHGKDSAVWLFGKQRPDEVSQEYNDGILSVLEPSGCRIYKVWWNGEEEGGFEQAIDTVMRDGRYPKVIAALDPQSLLGLADAGEESTVPVRLYGRGTSVKILNHLDRGRITGLCITDDYTAGYLSVRQAVDRIGSKDGVESLTLKSAYIEQEELHLAEYEKMLYPIE